MYQKFFSIITISKDNLDGLEKTHKSVSSQSFPDYEWIVIDGGSDDGSKSYLEVTDAIWVSENDAGIYDAMNKGIEKSSGVYLIFMNAGDRFASNDILSEIAGQIVEMEDSPDFIYGDALEEINRKKKYKAARPYIKSSLGLFTHHQAMFYNKNAIGNIRYNSDFKVAGDYDFTLKVLESSPRVLYCPFPICIYEAGGFSQKNMRLGRKEQFKIRHDQGRVSNGVNKAIYVRQSIAAFIRILFPPLYWLIKKLNY